jgi:hypothetical protein
MEFNLVHVKDLVAAGAFMHNVGFNQRGQELDFVHGHPEVGVVDVGAVRGVHLALKQLQVGVPDPLDGLVRGGLGQVLGVEKCE